MRCIDEHGLDVEADGLNDDAWRALKNRNRTERHLAMPCCDARVVLKTPTRRIRHFAHLCRGECDAEPETEVHRHIKQLARDIARSRGWDARTEVEGRTPGGDRWRADVLAEKDGRRGAVEIQWSGQTDEETLRRQRRYAASGVGCVWLTRQRVEPDRRELPVARITGTLDEGLAVEVHNDEDIKADERPHHNERQSRPITPEAFLEAVFEGRFRFGVRPRTTIEMTVYTGVLRDCWHCKAPARMVTYLNGCAGPHMFNVKADQLDEETERRIQPLIAAQPDMGLCPRAGRCRLAPGAWIYAVYNEVRTIGTVPWTIGEADLHYRGCDRWAVW